MRSPSACDIRCPAPMQQGDQPGAALVVKAALRAIHPAGSRVLFRARQRLADPGFQPLPFGGGSSAHAPFVVEDGQALDPIFLVAPGTSPGSCRRPQTALLAIASCSSCRHLAAPKALARRDSRCAADPSRKRSNSIRSCRDSGVQEAGTDHRCTRIASIAGRQAIPTGFPA